MLFEDEVKWYRRIEDYYVGRGSPLRNENASLESDWPLYARDQHLFLDLERRSFPFLLFLHLRFPLPLAVGSAAMGERVQGLIIPGGLVHAHVHLDKCYLLDKTPVGDG